MLLLWDETPRAMRTSREQLDATKRKAKGEGARRARDADKRRRHCAAAEPVNAFGRTMYVECMHRPDGRLGLCGSHGAQARREWIDGTLRDYVIRCVRTSGDVGYGVRVETLGQLRTLADADQLTAITGIGATRCTDMLRELLDATPAPELRRAFGFVPEQPAMTETERSSRTYVTVVLEALVVEDAEGITLRLVEFPALSSHGATVEAAEDVMRRVVWPDAVHNGRVLDAAQLTSAVRGLVPLRADRMRVLVGDAVRLEPIEPDDVPFAHGGAEVETTLTIGQPTDDMAVTFCAELVECRHPETDAPTGESAPCFLRPGHEGPHRSAADYSVTVHGELPGPLLTRLTQAVVEQYGQPAYGEAQPSGVEALARTIDEARTEVRSRMQRTEPEPDGFVPLYVDMMARDGHGGEE